MIYSKFSYLYPPRPENVIDKSRLNSFNSNYVAQLKMNGTCSIVMVKPSTQELICMNRHKEVHKAWIPDNNKMKWFLNLSGDGWYVFVTELLNNKVKGYKDINYIHDMLVYNGNYLVNKPQYERMKRLNDLVDNKIDKGLYYTIDQYTWLTKEFSSDFLGIFNSLKEDIQEGLVIKNKNTKLKLCLKSNSNNSDMFKCRRPTSLHAC